MVDQKSLLLPLVVVLLCCSAVLVSAVSNGPECNNCVKGDVWFDTLSYIVRKELPYETCDRICTANYFGAKTEGLKKCMSYCSQVGVEKFKSIVLKSGYSVDFCTHFQKCLPIPSSCETSTSVLADCGVSINNLVATSNLDDFQISFSLDVPVELGISSLSLSIEEIGGIKSTIYRKVWYEDGVVKGLNKFAIPITPIFQIASQQKYVVHVHLTEYVLDGSNYKSRHIGAKTYVKFVQ